MRQWPVCDRCRRLPGVGQQRNLRAHHLSVLGATSAGQQLKRPAIFSRQLDRLRLSSATHAPKLTLMFNIVKTI
jgi:hypothetical protein